MKSKQTKNRKGSKKIYDPIFDHTRAAILASSGMSEAKLDDAATELGVDYEIFCADYKGHELADCHEGFVEMLRQWPTPWPVLDLSSLNGLTLAQFFFVWAWDLNNTAKFLLNAEAVGHGWKSEVALTMGVRCAVSAAKSLAHAIDLMASGANSLGQEPNADNSFGICDECKCRPATFDVTVAGPHDYHAFCSARCCGLWLGLEEADPPELHRPEGSAMENTVR